MLWRDVGGTGSPCATFFIRPRCMFQGPYSLSIANRHLCMEEIPYFLGIHGRDQILHAPGCASGDSNGHIQLCATIEPHMMKLISSKTGQACRKVSSTSISNHIITKQSAPKCVLSK